MLQAGVATRDMDPQWMSSISWYVLCIFGLQSVFNYLLGSDNGKALQPCSLDGPLMGDSGESDAAANGPNGSGSRSADVWSRRGSA